MSKARVDWSPTHYVHQIPVASSWEGVAKPGAMEIDGHCLYNEINTVNIHIMNHNCQCNIGIKCLHPLFPKTLGMKRVPINQIPSYNNRAATEK